MISWQPIQADGAAEMLPKREICIPSSPRARYGVHVKFTMLITAFALVLGLAGFAAEPASRYTAPYPAAASIKGLQVQFVDDALALGVKNAAININLAQLVDPAGDPHNPDWQLDGQTYHFQRGYLASLDQQIKPLSDHGVVVTLIVLTYQAGNPVVDRILIHPLCITNAPNHLGNFNTVTDEGRRWLTATLEFCAEHWSRPDQQYGRVSGYIMGNEVNSHWWWANMGRVTMQEFADDYLRTVRLASTAIRRESSWARVYISLDHHWNIREGSGDELQGFPGRVFLDYFAQCARAGGDFDWNLAYHPYPENLFEPRFWNDKTATTNVLATPRITFKNLELLPAYFHRPEMLYHGQPRHIILSEQGFHTPKGPDGEAIQAAAFCYAYKKIERIDGIDAFILHRHVDNAGEGGLRLGLRGNQPKDGEPQPRKKIYACFRDADTPDWETTFKFALPVIGLESWSEVR